MSIRAFFIPQGFVIGEVVDENATSFVIKNPALVITRPNGLVLAPILQLVEENQITISLESVAFKTAFTPQVELANEYRKVFGSGIVVSNTLPF